MAAQPVDPRSKRGAVVIGGFAVNRVDTWNFDLATAHDENPAEWSQNPPNVYGFGHQAYYEHVVDCLLNGRHALVDGLEGRKSLELINAMYESSETGREVPLRFAPKRCRLGYGRDPEGA